MPTNLLGVLTKVDVEGKKITVVEKDTDKEIEIKITDETEQVSKKGNAKVDLEKLETKVKKAQDAGKKVNIKVTHDKNVASKLEFPRARGLGKRKIIDLAEEIDPIRSFSARPPVCLRRATSRRDHAFCVWRLVAIRWAVASAGNSRAFRIGTSRESRRLIASTKMSCQFGQVHLSRDLRSRHLRRRTKITPALCQARPDGFLRIDTLVRFRLRKKNGRANRSNTSIGKMDSREYRKRHSWQTNPRVGFCGK